MTVLGIDTATSRGSVALARPGTVLASASLVERGAHARELLGRIDRLLEETGIERSGLGALAVTLGPGSFTGVRVGLATAKGLAYALDVGLAGLSTLEALARAAIGEMREAPARRLCAVIEAGRGEVYAALFRIEGGEPVRETDDRSFRPKDLLAILPAGARLAGDGSDAVRAAARQAGREIEAIEPWPPLAGPLALWGCGVVRPGARYEPGGPRPNYVRPSGAEAAGR